MNGVESSVRIGLGEGSCKLGVVASTGGLCSSVGGVVRNSVCGLGGVAPTTGDSSDCASESGVFKDSG